MLLGIVSDTHGHIENTQSAVRLLESLGVAQVIHCGDLGSNEIPPLFARWPTHFVFGNVDHDEAGLRAAIRRAKLTCHERFGQLELAGRRIAFLHGDDNKLFRSTVGIGGYDVVCYGHTHVAKQERVGTTLVLNPGALYRASPHSIAVVDLTMLEASIVRL